jgi:hypothetical protein
MNVFPLDENFAISAQYHVDSHVTKIPLECAQMMSTACRYSGCGDVGYESTHINHPMNKWVRECIDNWLWMYSYAQALNEEYKYRYNHTDNHKAFDVILTLPVPVIPMYGIVTPMPLCMPDYCKISGDPIKSYRKYYIHEKSHLWKWKKRPTPNWITRRFV